MTFCKKRSFLEILENEKALNSGNSISKLSDKDLFHHKKDKITESIVLCTYLSNEIFHYLNRIVHMNCKLNVSSRLRKTNIKDTGRTLQLGGQIVIQLI